MSRLIDRLRVLSLECSDDLLTSLRQPAAAHLVGGTRMKVRFMSAPSDDRLLQRAGKHAHRCCGAIRRRRTRRRVRGGGIAAVQIALLAPVFFLFALDRRLLRRALRAQQLLFNTSAKGPGREGARQTIARLAASADVAVTDNNYSAHTTLAYATGRVMSKAFSTVVVGKPPAVNHGVLFDRDSSLYGSRRDASFPQGRFLTGASVVCGERF